MHYNIARTRDHDGMLQLDFIKLRIEQLKREELEE